MNNKSKNKGFTLIEVIVVVTIIAIFFSIMIPRLKVSLMRARDRRAVNLLKALNDGSQIYYFENGSTLYSTGNQEGRPAPNDTTLRQTAFEYTHLNVLRKENYIDKKIYRYFRDTASGRGQPLTFNVGTVQDFASNCIDYGKPVKKPAYTGGSVNYIFDSTGVGVRIQTNGKVDTDCNAWDSF